MTQQFYFGVFNIFYIFFLKHVKMCLTKQNAYRAILLIYIKKNVFLFNICARPHFPFNINKSRSRRKTMTHVLTFIFNWFYWTWTYL